MKPDPNVGWPLSAKPEVFKNVDGPVLRTRDGQLHWLNLWERLMYWIGWANAKTLEDKHWRRTTW